LLNLFAAPRDSIVPIESIDCRVLLVQYPVWCPENFGHLQTSMWLRPDHTDTQRIPAIADRGSMLVGTSADRSLGFG
jgi:hypothetical protein